MGGSNYQQFFTRPTDFAQRHYECLRAVFVEGIPMKDVAERFEVAYGTVRNWAHKFRTARDQGESPPFFFRLRADVPRPRTRPDRTRRSPRSPMPKRSR